MTRRLYLFIRRSIFYSTYLLKIFHPLRHGMQRSMRMICKQNCCFFFYYCKSKKLLPFTSLHCYCMYVSVQVVCLLYTVMITFYA